MKVLPEWDDEKEEESTEDEEEEEMEVEELKSNSDDDDDDDDYVVDTMEAEEVEPVLDNDYNHTADKMDVDEKGAELDNDDNLAGDAREAGRAARLAKLGRKRITIKLKGQNRCKVGYMSRFSLSPESSPVGLACLGG